MWEQLDGFDENISMCEDWPMWLKVTLHGEKILLYGYIYCKI